MNEDYYLYLENEQKGPYTLRQLQTMWAAGSITGETMYWQEGFDEWCPLNTMRDLLEIPEPKKPSAAYAAAVAVASGKSEEPIGVLEYIWMMFLCFGLAIVGFLFGAYYLTQPTMRNRGIVMVVLSVFGFGFWTVAYFMGGLRF